MMWVIFLALISPILSCEQSRYLKAKNFNDFLLFENFTLGPPTLKSKNECAKECHKNPRCTVFSLSPAMGPRPCQLYGDVVYPDVASAGIMPGRRYYVYTNEVCPYENEFMVLRKSNQCIRIFNTEFNYTQAIAECGKFEARPIVLEDEDKANATLDLLQKNGNTDDWFFIGAQVQTTNPNFVWADGQPVIRDWWKDGEPNNSNDDENCTFINKNAMSDVNCDETFWFICEVARSVNVM